MTRPVVLALLLCTLLPVEDTLTLSNGVGSFSRVRIYVPSHCVYSVVEQCGAIPGLEDKEGEVSELAMIDITYFFSDFRDRQLYTKLPFMDTSTSSHISSQIKPMCILEMPMDGQHCTTRAQRYGNKRGF